MRGNVRSILGLFVGRQFREKNNRKKPIFIGFTSHIFTRRRHGSKGEEDREANTGRTQGDEANMFWLGGLFMFGPN